MEPSVSKSIHFNLTAYVISITSLIKFIKSEKIKFYRECWVISEFSRESRDRIGVSISVVECSTAERK